MTQEEQQAKAVIEVLAKQIPASEADTVGVILAAYGRGKEDAERRFKEAAEFTVMAIEHAIHLDYLGEGSTRGMALEALGKLRVAANIDGEGNDSHRSTRAKAE